MPSPPSSTEQLIELLKKSGVSSPERLSDILKTPLPPDPQKAAAALVAQGSLTKFQALQLLAGRHKGFRIGPYTILDLLGRGGMGAVYLAEHLALHRKVAIKVLVPGKEEDHKLATVRFQREARAVAALDHPNIVRIFDVANHQGVPYLVMEYVEGETLQAALDRDGPVPFTTATEYIAQAASGLQHAFEKGFIHRDIKPGNLIRDTTGTVKILDMGLARSVSPTDQLTAKLDQGAVVGTADFIAPEQAINNPTVDIRADIYSLGASLFALISGKPPFEGNTTQKLLQHQLRNAPALDSVDATIPKGLSLVVDKMLAKKPEDRYQTPAEVISALTPWLASSARIIVGISRTLLAEDEGLQASLSGSYRTGSSLNLPVIPTLGDSSEVGDLQFAKETGTLASAKTTRESNRPGQPSDKPRKFDKRLIGGIGLSVLAGLALGAWFYFHSGQNADVELTFKASEDGGSRQEAKPADKVASNPVVPPKITPSTPPADAAEGTERVLFSFEASGQQPFIIRSGMVTDPNDPSKREHKELSRSGPGDPPAGWYAMCWHADSEIDFFSELFSGKTTIGIRNLRSPGSAMLFGPNFDCPTSLCRLKVTYQAAIHEKRFSIKFKPSDQRDSWEIATPQATGEVWRSEDLIVDLKGAAGGCFEFHNGDGDPNAAIRIRSIAISELKPSTAKVDSTLFSLDPRSLPKFSFTLRGDDRISGDPAPKIKGVALGGFKRETVSEWTCGDFEGAKALGFTNVNEVRSARVVVELESETGLGLKFEPGQRVRVRLVYRTANSASGNMMFQSYGDWKILSFTRLPNSNANWKTVDVLLVRGEKPVRLLVDVGETGAGNTLFIRSLTVNDAGKDQANGLEMTEDR